MRYLLALLTLVGLGFVAPAQAQQWLPGGEGIPIVCAYSPSPPTLSAQGFVYAQCSANGTLLGGGSSGGGAVTLASGAVAAGAYSAGSMAAGAFVSGSFLSGALADGAIVTLGTEADTAWSSGNGTAIAILKKIAGNTASFSGAVTIADGADVTLGSKADTALTTGSATLIALTKGLITQIQASIPAGANFIGALVPPATMNQAQGSCGTGTGSSALVAARTGVAGTGRQSVTIVNDGTTDIYIGNTGVTTSTGLLIVGIKGASFTLSTTAAIFCVAASTEAVSYIESY